MAEQPEAATEQPEAATEQPEAATEQPEAAAAAAPPDTVAEQSGVRHPLPGTDVVGRGVYLRPRRPYELKDFLFKQDNPQLYYSPETQGNYTVWDCYAVNESPPMPANRMLNQTLIEETWDRFDKQMGMDVSMAVSGQAFSVDAQASQATQLRSEEDAYYALRSSFIPLWAVYIPNANKLSETAFDEDAIPAPFDPENRWAYTQFFARYGTHYVKRAWVGGKATLTFIVNKSSNMSKEDIQAGIKASYGGLGESSLKTQLQESKERLQSNSECRVFGKGGDELRLASLSSLDEAAYNAWVSSIPHNPQVIEFDVVGIWTLVRDQAKAEALQAAYQMETVFPPISAIFRLKDQIGFLRGNQYFAYDLETQARQELVPIESQWPVLKDCGFEWVDAAFSGQHLGGEWQNKLYFFKEDEYVCLEVGPDNSMKIHEGPKRIAEGWPGVSFDRLDAALNAGPDAVYFFRGNEYIRYNFATGRADEGYPDLIGRRWAGVAFDRINAAIYWGDGKTYFFKDDQYVRYDMTIYQADPGYPKFLPGGYIQDWKFFA